MARVNIEDVARASGVSVATVSRALRGLPNVSPATRRRVMEVASHMGYRPDPNAARLAAGKTATVGLCVTAIPIWYTGQVSAGAEAVLTVAGYDLVLIVVADRQTRRRTLGEAAGLAKRVDGLLMVDIVPTADERVGLQRAGLPWVMVGAADPSTPSVVVDNMGGAAQAARHLLELGHRRIGLISGGRAAFENSTPRERRDGFVEALAEAGVRFDPRLERPGNFSALGGYEAMMALLESSDRPSAVFAMSDEMAIGAARAAAERGLKVPDDLSVVGFDDHELAFAFGLTTIRQPATELGSEGARRLLGLLDGGPGDGRIVLPTELVVRESTGPPREKHP
ncbi:MAG: LacI family transcriptional regulator [Acidimicrobiia bacterium]|nr:MAG: LacI family transcriptional regulator [Acidimicrobiia bacterium]